MVARQKSSDDGLKTDRELLQYEVVVVKALAGGITKSSAQGASSFCFNK